MSSFMKRAKIFFLWRSLIICCTYKKLLWMQRFLMKALWLMETNLPSSGARRLVSIFVMSLANEWIKLMGLKSLTLCALGFFGMSTTHA
jgi:hypothetical protein